MRRFTLILALFLAPTFACAQTKDPVFDVAALTATPLNAKVLKGPYEKDGVMVEEIQFHSEMDGAKSVDIFGILAYPKGAKNLPAFIWNQGGLYQASDYFPIYGAKHGYTALCIDFPIGGYRSTGGYPINSTLATADDPKTAPIYHGAVALLKAVTYLESRPEVDKNKIGMCGSSWGGYYTTLMIGVDPRLKVGSAMFGCGFLDTGNNWWGYPGAAQFPKPEYVKQWAATFDAGPRLAHTKTPMGWFTGTDDMFYWMPALMKSYEAAAGPKQLTLFPNWAHALPSEGDDEVFAFLDVYLQGKPALLKVSPIKIEKQGDKTVATWIVTGARKAKSAEILLSYGDSGNWLSRHWKTLPGELNQLKSSEGDAYKGIVVLPASPVPYYISGGVIDSDKFLSSTPLVRVDVAALGLLDAKAKIEDDGADMWGGFEADQITWAVRHGFMNSTVSPDAHSGKQSAKLAAGAHRLFPLYFTANLPHRLSLFAKADKPTEVSLHFGGLVPKAAQEDKKFAVGTTWTELKLDVTTPDQPNAGMDATLTVPAGASVLIDDVSFRPQ